MTRIANEPVELAPTDVLSPVAGEQPGLAGMHPSLLARDAPPVAQQERFKAAPSRGKVRRFMQFYDAAQSWRRVERIIARVEAGPAGTDTRFIVTNLSGGRAKHLYEGL